MTQRLDYLALCLAVAGAAMPAALAQHGPGKPETVLYVWASDQAHRAPDFLAVVDFDQDSANYGKVIKTVPIPPPGNIGNEPHHCHLIRRTRRSWAAAVCSAC